MVGLGKWDESGPGGWRWVAKMAAPNHISPLLLSSTEQSAPGLPAARPSPKARGSNSCQVRLLLYPESILLLSLEPADPYNNKLGATLTVVRIERVPHTGRYLIRTAWGHLVSIFCGLTNSTLWRRVLGYFDKMHTWTERERTYLACKRKHWSLSPLAIK
jgi:hypothetical protein